VSGGPALGDGRSGHALGRDARSSRGDIVGEGAFVGRIYCVDASTGSEAGGSRLCLHIVGGWGEIRKNDGREGMVKLPVGMGLYGWRGWGSQEKDDKTDGGGGSG
jgi:hypothetical protein